MRNLVLDIETLPTIDPSVIAEIAGKIIPPGNISKSDTIAVWHEEKKPALIKEAVARTSFDGTFGSIVAIGWAIDYEEPEVICHANELQLLITFVGAINDAIRVKEPLKIIGHNIASFDLRFLWQRLIINGISPPAHIPWNAKPWDERIGDTMIMWNPEREKRISLDCLCKALRVTTSKGDMDGSMVAGYASQGRYAEIASYCVGDVVATRECYRRMSI
jgi:DNA polymerase elongation subunit (family B)